MKKLFKILLATAAMLAAAAGWTQQAPELGPKVETFLEQHGGKYGLRSDAGKLLYLRPDFATGKVSAQPLSAAVTQRVVLFLSTLPEGDVEPAMSAALRAFLRGARPELTAKLFVKSAAGETLSDAGRKVLMDILTAEDGLAFQPQTGSLGKGFGMKPAVPLPDAGFLSTPGGLEGYFDRARGRGAMSGGSPYRVGRFDWAGLSTGQAKLDGFSVNEERKTVRVMVAAKRTAAADRLFVRDAAEASNVARETGLDEKLLAEHGAQVVRAIRNLVMLDVPVDRVGNLGRALDEQGLESRPARVVRMATSALRTGPRWPDPLYASMPIRLSAVRQAESWRGGSPAVPTFEGATGKSASVGSLGFQTQGREARTAGTVAPLNAGSRDLMKIGAMHSKGMTGKGTVVGIIDSGLDLQHPDFKDRVTAYIDLTGDGLRDTVAHGTHVAGSVGGSGAASDGLYKGMAPDTKFVVIKVFGRSGSTSEDTILAAMTAARNMPKEVRPDVINMSLGGPGDPDTDPLNVLANEMMLKDNILMAIAAGNSGPSRGTVSAPGSAKYVMTVTGVNHDSKFSFFPSRGPISGSNGGWNKPDLSTVAGDVSLSQHRKAFWRRLLHPLSTSDQLGLFPARVRAGAEPEDPSCFYGPGVISARSGDDTDAGCGVKGNPRYRYMSGTSMATPMAAGIAADTIGYLKANGRAYQAAEVKALMMETATDLGQAPEIQGAGLVDGAKLAKALEERVKQGLPVGNLAYMVAQRGASKWDEFNIKENGRFERTELGLMDKRTGHLANSDREYDGALKATRDEYKQLPWYGRAWRRVRYWFNG